MTQSTTSYSFGDVVLVPFPFTDQSATKKRPAVVVSSNNYNAQRPDVILMAITSQESRYLRIGEVIIQDWKAGGLLKASTIKPILTTIEKSLVIRRLGGLHARSDEIEIGFGYDHRTRINQFAGAALERLG